MFFKVIECLEKSNNQINTKHSEINRLQKYIEYIKYKTNEQSAKYFNQSMKIKNWHMFENIDVRIVLAVFTPTCSYGLFIWR